MSDQEDYADRDDQVDEDLDLDDALAEAVQYLATIAERSIKTEKIETLQERAQNLSNESKNPTSYSENLRGLY